jgi:hypothetical protein
MGIFRESKEEMMARSIAGTPSRGSDVVISKQQKELDFDQQILRVLKPEQEALRGAIEVASQGLVDKSEQAIIDTAKPTHVDQLLRISLWEEMSNAITEARPISETAIYSGICSANYWRKVRDENHDLFTYLLIPIKEYSRTNKLLLTLGQECLMNILNADPFVKKEGSYKKVLDPKIAKVQLEAYRMVEERVYGKAVNRIQTHNVNEATKGDAHETIEALKAEIIALENKSGPILIDGEFDE